MVLHHGGSCLHASKIGTKTSLTQSTTPAIRKASESNFLSPHPITFAFGPAEGSIDLVTGSDFGVEASIAGTGVLVVALVIAFVAYRRQEAKRGVTAVAVPAVG